MALTMKYEMDQFHVEIRHDGTHIVPALVATAADGNAVKLQGRVMPDFKWEQLPAPIQATLTTLSTQVLDALKAYYGTQAVTLLVPSGDV